MTAARNTSVTDFTLTNEPLGDEEISLILAALFKKIDVPARKSEPAPKTILMDFFGIAKTMKTSTTTRVEQPFRRCKFNTFCPPETAELAEIRNKSSESPIVFQARHLAGVEDYVLNLATDRSFHVAILSRGLIDMLYWYERGTRKGLYSAAHHESAKQRIYELLRLDLVDSFVFFTCSPEVAIKREYDGALTQERGSDMSESSLVQSLAIYEEVLADVEKHVPGLPIFRLDTSDCTDPGQAARELLRLILPAICKRFGVRTGSFLPRSPSLIEKQTRHNDYFEEQLKLKGYPSLRAIESAGFVSIGTAEQEDTYLNPHPEKADSDGYFDEIVRLRREGNAWKFIHKGPQNDRIFSHRRPLSMEVDAEDVLAIRGRYPELLTLKKTRRCFNIEGASAGDSWFTLHLDNVEGLGAFSELRAHGSSESTHSEELLRLAEKLGFGLDDIVEGSYLALALKKK